MSYETALFQWEDGSRTLRDATPGERRVLEDVHDRLVAELRRRLGGSFTLGELVALYDDGAAWAYELALKHAPDHPAAWQPAVVDAAFAKDSRGARR